MIDFSAEVKEVKVWGSSSNDKVIKVVLITDDENALKLASYINETPARVRVDEID